MPRTRFIKSPDEIARLQRILHGPAFVDIRSLSVSFLSDPEVIAELVPPPLQPASEPRVSVSVSEIRRSNCVGPFNGCTVNIACTYEGQPGLYSLMMPMNTDTAVIFGRELFAEPKKLADIRLGLQQHSDGSTTATGTVERHGITYIELGGQFAEPMAERETSGTSHHYFFKYLPAANGQGLAHDPELVRVTHRGTSFRSTRGRATITFRESEHDPIVDVPVLDVGDAILSEGQTITHAEVVATVPQDQFMPYAFWKVDNLLAWEGDVSEAEMNRAAALA